MEDAVETSAMRKIYWRLLPLAVVSYLLAYIDRINVSFAGLTMRDDLAMSAAAFGFALGTFYWGYSVFAVSAGGHASEIRSAAAARSRSRRRASAATFTRRTSTQSRVCSPGVR